MDSNLPWNKLQSLLPRCVDSPVRSFKRDDAGALWLDFQLKTPDWRLQKFCELVPGKWRPPATYRILPQTIVSEDLLLFLEWSELKPERVAWLKLLSDRFAPFARHFPETKPKTGTPIVSTDGARDLVFAALGEQKLTGRELSLRAGITEMTLHNYKKTGKIRLENFLKLAQALGVELRWR